MMSHIIYLLLIGLIILQHSISIPINEPIPLSLGSEYAWSWDTEIGLSIVGVILNSLTLSLLLEVDHSKLPFYSLNLAINTSDMIFCIGRIAFSSVFKYYNAHVGGDSICLFETAFFLIFIEFPLLLIVGISLIAKYDLCHNKKLSNVNIRLYILYCLIYSVCVSCLCLFLPGAGYTLQSSSTYCFLSSSSGVGVSIIVGLGNFVPQGFLGYNLYMTYKYVKAAQRLLDHHGIKETAKEPYINMVVKLGWFYVTSTAMYTPMVIGLLYELIFKIYIPPIVSIINEFTTILLSAIINPVLFFTLNSLLREKFYIRFGLFAFVHKIIEFEKATLVNKEENIKNILLRRAYIALLILSGNNRKSAIKAKFVNVRVHPKEMPSQKKNTISFVDSVWSYKNDKSGLNYDDMRVWLNDLYLYGVFQGHARKEYCVENFLFYTDAKEYASKGILFVASIKQALEIASDDNLEFSDQIIQDWVDLETLALRICVLYVKAPMAPLEINIPSKLRKSLTDKVNSDNHFPSLIDVRIRNQDILSTVNQYAHLFDECIEVVYQIIETDSWPRFRRKDEYRAAIDAHRKIVKDNA